MTGPLFGSASQLWPTVPLPGIAYWQAPDFPGVRSFATPPGVMTNQSAPFAGGIGPSVPIAHTTPADPYAFGGGGIVPTAGVPTAGPGWFGVMPGSMGSGVPVFASPEMGVGITVPALVATVAMRRGAPQGPTSDQEIEDFISDALDLLPGVDDVEVRCEGGRTTLTGAVPHKRLKRDVGEIAWAIPNVNDVQNNVTIAARRRSRPPGRETEAPAPPAARKQS